METITIIAAVVALIIGLAIGFFIAKSIVEKGKASSLIANAKKEAESILKAAEVKGDKITSEKLYRGKEKFMDLKSKHEKEIMAREQKMKDAEKRTKDKESAVSNELSKNKKLSQFIGQPISELKIVMGNPDSEVKSETGLKILIYTTKKYGIPC